MVDVKASYIQETRYPMQLGKPSYPDTYFNKTNISGSTTIFTSEILELGPNIRLQSILMTRIIVRGAEEG